MRRRTFKMKIARVARLMARGVIRSEIAKQMGISTQTISGWQREHGELLDRLIEKEKCAIIVAVRKEAVILKVVRKAAGTKAVFADPDQYMKMAMRAVKIAEDRNEPLFESSGEETLSTFFESCFLPMVDGGKGTLYNYRLAVNRWKCFSGDPPLKEITSPMLAKFKWFLSKLHGIKNYRRASPETVKIKLRHIQTILDKAGPPGPRNRDAVGIIGRVPYVKPPKVPILIPQIVTDSQLNDCYFAAVGMEKPRFYGIKPAAWWRLLLVMAYCTGLRRGTLFSLRMTDIDWEDRRLVIPAKRMKAGRDHIIHLNSSAMEHLRKNRTDREYILPWPHHDRWFDNRFHKLQDLAGIPRADHFGLHNIRKTTATRLWEIAPQAAQLALGHAGSDVTIRHYVQSAGIVAKALDALPQPSAFGG